MKNATRLSENSTLASVRSREFATRVFAVLRGNHPRFNHHAKESRMLRTIFVSIVLALALPALAEGDEYFGFDLDRLAEAVARQTTLRTQYGEAEGNVRFDAWLAEGKSSRDEYTRAWNSWWERFRADKTGKLEAQFHTLNSVYVQKMNFSDVPDKRNEKQAGVTLEAYAKIVAEMTQNPNDIDGVLARNGIKSQAQWQKVNEAWVAAMKADTTFALTQQYAALFQKYAGPQFQEAQQQRLADAIAAGDTRDRPATPRPSPPTIDETVALLDSNDRVERWTASREYARQCDLWLGPARKDPKDARAKHCGQATLESKLLPVILDAVDHFDDDTVSYGTFAIDFLDDLNLKTSSAKIAIQRALNRSRARLETLEATFAPIQDKAIPERITLRRKIDDYTEAVREFESTLATW